MTRLPKCRTKFGDIRVLENEYILISIHNCQKEGGGATENNNFHGMSTFFDKIPISMNNFFYIDHAYKGNRKRP